VLANGRTLAEGRATEVRSNPAVIEAYLGTHAAEDVAHAGH
jgi:branched-chain amino acid transport system ATP-binding protein